jgi:2-(1,2-epoxy-1,2-dihydrophenyl)acetyl-CoA isomerase
MLESNPSILTARRDGILTITMNRPDRLNAITIPAMQRLHQALLDAEADAECGCVILTAHGKGFCAGQDLRVLAAHYDHHHPGSLGEIIDRDYNAIVQAIVDLKKPVIAAVQGVAAGAGWSLALACDIRVAARSARFVPAFAKLGLIPDLGGTYALVRAVGYAKAMEFALLTDSMTADEAMAFGIVNRVVDDVELAVAAEAIARRLCSLPGSGVALTKQALRDAQDQALTVQLARESQLQSIGASADGHVGLVNSFAGRGS